MSASDDPLVWFEGSDVTDASRRYHYSDQRGSFIGVLNGNADADADALNVDSYDEFGIPVFANAGQLLYTGQA